MISSAGVGPIVRFHGNINASVALLMKIEFYSKIPRKFPVIKKGQFFNQSFSPTNSIFRSLCLKSGTYK